MVHQNHKIQEQLKTYCALIHVQKIVKILGLLFSLRYQWLQNCTYVINASRQLSQIYLGKFVIRVYIIPMIASVFTNCDNSAISEICLIFASISDLSLFTIHNWWTNYLSLISKLILSTKVLSELRCVARRGPRFCTTTHIQMNTVY